MYPALRTSDAFLYEVLADDIQTLIRRGTLRPGDRVPSVRKFSIQKGVSISSVLQAYRMLEDQGVIEARPQSGFYVRLRPALQPQEPPVTQPPSSPAEVSVASLILEVLSHDYLQKEMAPLGSAVASPDYFPTRKLNRLLSNEARLNGDACISYPPPQGIETLRYEIAKRALNWGCSLSSNDLIITNGCMEALMLCLRATTKPGDTVAVESPCYFGVLQLIESFHLKVLEIPTHPRDGISIDALEQAIRERPVHVCLTTPNFHNPVGSCMPEKNKRALVDLLSEHNIPVIEDDLYGDLYFGEKRPRSLKAYDRRGLVLHCSSFSKTLAPGYRVGWTAPGRYLNDIKRLKFAATIATAAPTQLAIAEFLKRGGYDHHMRRLRRTFAQNIDRTRQAIMHYFPEGTKVTRPSGGYVLWIEFPESVDALVLYRQALRENIGIMPGPIFSATGRYSNCIRLSCGYPWNDAFDASMQRLGELAAALV